MNKKRPDLREKRTIQFLSFPVLSQGVCVCVFWLYREACVACEILVITEPQSLAVKSRSPYHWAIREFPQIMFLLSLSQYLLLRNS